VIFDSNDHVKMASGDALIKYAATGSRRIKIGNSAGGVQRRTNVHFHFACPSRRQTVHGVFFTRTL